MSELNMESCLFSVCQISEKHARVVQGKIAKRMSCALAANDTRFHGIIDIWSFSSMKLPQHATKLGTTTDRTETSFSLEHNMDMNIGMTQWDTDLRKSF